MMVGEAQPSSASPSNCELMDRGERLKTANKEAQRSLGGASREEKSRNMWLLI